MPSLTILLLLIFFLYFLLFLHGQGQVLGLGSVYLRVYATTSMDCELFLLEQGEHFPCSHPSLCSLHRHGARFLTFYRQNALTGAFKRCSAARAFRWRRDGQDFSARVLDRRCCRRRVDGLVSPLPLRYAWLAWRSLQKTPYSGMREHPRPLPKTSACGDAAAAVLGALPFGIIASTSHWQHNFKTLVLI